MLNPLPGKPRLGGIGVLLCGLLAACTYYPTKGPPDPPPVTCDNGHIDPGEACDTKDLGGKSCETVAVPGHPKETFYRGNLACGWNCLDFDTSNCSGFCGDSVIDADAPGSPEVCDWQNLGGRTCQNTVSPSGAPYYGGDLRCTSDCRALDTSGCTGYCGDGQLQIDHGESCDGTNFGSDSCKARGFYRGQLQCDGDCRTLDAQCNGRCGDGVLDADFGEQCDLSPTDTCQAHGFYRGQTSCTGNCRIDTSQCSGFCGDGICDDADGENCKTCASDCACGIFGNCDAEGFCICVTPRNTFVDCNNGWPASETLHPNCLSCGDPSCDSIRAPDFGVAWKAYPDMQPTKFSQCSDDGRCSAWDGTLFYTDGCEPWFSTNHMDGTTSDLGECIQLLIDDFQSKGLWPAGRARFGPSSIHLVSLQSPACQ